MQLLDFPAVRDFVDKTVSAAVSAAVSTAQHKDILRVVSARFGATPPELEQRLQALTDGERLGALLEHAATCQDLDAFRAKL